LSKDAVKTAVQQQVAYTTISLQHPGGPLIERRRAKRFQVDWQVRVECVGGSGTSFIESGKLYNISSTGALLSIGTRLSKGTRLDVYVKLPLQGKNWMKYAARIVRVEPDAAAVRFDTSRPDFKPPLAPV
jgi:hypothetical protein